MPFPQEKNFAGGGNLIEKRQPAALEFSAGEQQLHPAIVWGERIEAQSRFSMTQPDSTARRNLRSAILIMIEKKGW